MHTAGQKNNSANITRCRYQEPVASIVNRVENPITTFRLVLLQSTASQFYDNYTFIITQIIVQLIRVPSLLFNVPTICILEIRREKCRHTLLPCADITVLVYHPIAGIMEKLTWGL